MIGGQSLKPYVVQDSYYWGSQVTIDSLGLQISHAIMFIQGFIILSTVRFKNIAWITSWIRNKFAWPCGWPLH